nr:immunoglobulin light chain junction region [Macaca mulatta]
CQQGHLYPRTF